MALEPDEDGSDDEEERTKSFERSAVQGEFAAALTSGVAGSTPIG